MTTPTTSASSKPGSQGSQTGQPSSTVARSSEVATGNPSALQTSQGNTTIADGVVSKIAGMAASQVSGIHALGGGAARAFGSLRDRIPGASSSQSQGVSVEVGETQAAIDLDVVAEYGVSIADLSKSIRKSVISSVEGMTGLEVVEVNISVNDIHLPGEDDDNQGDKGDKGRQQEPARVQ